MKCENCFCIYQSNGECMLETVAMDKLGMCAECIYPEIDEAVLNRAKRNCLNRYEKKNHANGKT